MDLELHARHFTMTDRVRDHVEKKIGRLDRHLPEVSAARVDLDHSTTRHQGDKFTAQVTAWVSGSILRAEEHHPEVLGAIDMAAAKLQRQIERFKGRRLQRWHDHAKPLNAITDGEEPVEDEDRLAPNGIVRRKKFAIFPMTEAEAVDQLELLGHDFFLFLNGNTGNVNLVYHRQDGGVGLIEPELM